MYICRSICRSTGYWVFETHHLCPAVSRLLRGREAFPFSHLTGPVSLVNVPPLSKLDPTTC